MLIATEEKYFVWSTASVGGRTENSLTFNVKTGMTGYVFISEEE